MKKNILTIEVTSLFFITALAQNIKNNTPLKSSSQGIDYSIRKTIKKMLKSPQGSKNK